MKIMIRHKINFNQVDELIERYYEGMTSVEEEKKLQKLLSRPDLPKQYETEKAILGFFDKQKKQKHFSIQPYVRWASVAAVIGLFIVGARFISIEHPTDYAYVDGVKITNMQEVKSQALASLSDLSSKNNEVEEGLNDLNDNNLIEQQLDVFSGLK